MGVTLATAQAGLARQGAREPNEDQIRQGSVPNMDDFEFYSKNSGESLGYNKQLGLWFSNY